MELASASTLLGGSGFTSRGSDHLPVLIVEDNPDGRMALGLLLQCLGYPVEAAADGLEGLTKALSRRPAIALIDIGLPGMDGYQLAATLRTAFGDRIFLVAQTAYGFPEDRRRALAAGFNVHLVKPLDLDDLRHWLSVGETAVRNRTCFRD